MAGPPDNLFDELTLISAADLELELAKVDKRRSSSTTSSEPAKRKERPRQAGQLGWCRPRGRYWTWTYREAADENGRRKQVSKKIDLLENLTYDEARAIADQMADDLLPLHGATCSWPRWCRRYLTVYATLLRSSSRAVVTSVIRKHLMPAFRRANVSSIRTAHVQAWVSAMHRAGASPDSIRLRYSILAKVLRAAKREGLSAQVPAPRAIELPRPESVESSPARAFTLEQVRAVLEAAPEPLRTIVALCGACHLRISEALGLRVEDIDLEAERFRVTRQASRGRITRPKTKATSAAARGLPPLLVDHLRAHAPESGFLFPSPRGEARPLHDTTVRKQLNELLDRLGYKEPRRAFHAFRHAFATEAARAGVPADDLRRALGHSDARSTARYVHTENDAPHREIARVESAFLGGFEADPGRPDTVPSSGSVVPLRPARGGSGVSVSRRSSVVKRKRPKSE